MNKEQYQKYLKTNHWKVVKAWKLYQQDNTCENCGSKHHLQVHHLSYDNLHNERLTDLKVLCRDCHKHYHIDEVMAVICGTIVKEKRV